MNAKLVVISLYIVLIYWISSQWPSMHALFYPTLGAFSFLLATREFDLKHAGRILVGATVAAALGTSLHALVAGVPGLLADTLVVGWLIHRFRLNAPPILAVSIIPFFVEQPNVWAEPVAVLVSLAGLIGVLGAVRVVSERWQQLAIRTGGIAPEID